MELVHFIVTFSVVLGVFGSLFKIVLPFIILFYFAKVLYMILKFLYRSYKLNKRKKLSC